MRTIEEEIIDALNGGNGIKNLSFRDFVEVDGNTKEYYLWNNLLFWNDAENNYCFSARSCNSQTTKSRLNALVHAFFDASITQKDCKWFLEWNGKKYPVDVFSAYKFNNNKLYKMGAIEEEVKPL